MAAPSKGEDSVKNALLHDGLSYWAREAPDRLAAVFDDSETLTYAELDAWSDATAARLQAAGVRPHDRVGIAGANSMAWLACAFGVLKAGGVIVPMNDRFVAAEFAYLIEACEPRVVLADPPRAEVIAPVIGGSRLMTLAEATADRRPPRGFAAVRVESDDLAQIIFTSGTTGRPKGVMIAHGQLLSKYYEMYLTLPAFGSPDLSSLLTVSLHSGVGTTWGYLLTTTNGGLFSFMSRFEAPLALDMLVRHRVTMLATFPLVLERLAQEPAFASADLSGIRLAVTGGTRIPPEVLTTWREKGVLLRSMYGITEGGNYVTIASDREVLENRTTCGRPMPFTRLRIVGGDGEDCAAGQPGEIWVKGAGMMVGYWNDPAATAETLIDGWVHTGDIGVRDAEGYLTFVDRAKDMIISSGYNVSPTEIENVVADFPEIVEAAAFAVPDERFGEVPALCVVTDFVVSEAAIFEHCRARLAGFKLPRYIIARTTPLPRNTNGKVKKRELRDEYTDAPARYPRLG